MDIFYQNILKGNIKEVKKFLRYGFDINTVFDLHKETPLMLAVNERDYYLVEFLLEKGANLNARDWDGQTALHKSSWLNGDLDILELLIEYGANVDAIDKHRRTPLMIAAGVNRTDIVKFLIGHGANVNARNDNGSTALIIAATHDGNLKTVKYLVNWANADITIHDNDGETALMIATQKELDDIAKFMMNSLYRYVARKVGRRSIAARKTLQTIGNKERNNGTAPLPELPLDIAEKIGRMALNTAFGSSSDIIYLRRF